MQDKITRVFQKLAIPCQFIPADGSAPFARWLDLSGHKTQTASAETFGAEPILLATFLLSEGTPQAGDKFVHQGEYFQLNQLYWLDATTAQWIYI